MVSSLSSKKRTKSSRQVLKTNLSVRFLEETSAWKNHFEFVWPLPISEQYWELFYTTCLKSIWSVHRSDYYSKAWKGKSNLIRAQRWLHHILRLGGFKSTILDSSLFQKGLNLTYQLVKIGNIPASKLGPSNLQN